MSMSRLASVIALSVCFAGCKGLGSPIVDRFGSGGGKTGCLREPVSCKVPKPVHTLGDVAPTDTKLPACPLPSPAQPVRENLNLSQCVLRVEANADALRELVGATLFDMRIELSADAALQLTDSNLTQVAIMGDAIDADSGGSLFITHSKLHASKLAVREAELLSSTLSFSDVTATELSGVDLELLSSQLHPRHATLSTAVIRGSGIDDCDTLLLAGVNLRDSYLEGCNGATRIYQSTVNKSTFDGQLEFDFSTFADCSFGVGSPSRLTTWNAGFENVALCGQLEQLRSSSGSLSCVRCEGPLAEDEADACMDATAHPAIGRNACPALEEEEFPQCAEFPRRERPLDGT